MFIYNCKINGKKIVKLFILIAAIIVLILLAMIISKICSDVKDSNSKSATISDTIPSPDVAELTVENYTDILKEVHEDLNTYIGQRISFIGYVYRVDDLNEDEFILARDMVINSKNQTVVVRILMQK